MVVGKVLSAQRSYLLGRLRVCYTATLYRVPISCAFRAGGLKALTLFRSLCYGQMFVLAVIFLVDTKEALRVWAEATSSFYV